MDNYQQVILQMEDFGIKLRDKDVPLRLDTTKKVTCGDKGKDWYRLYLFRPDAGGSYITGSFGTYRHGGSWEKVEVEWAPLTEAERERRSKERAALKAESERARAAEIANAAAEAIDVWRQGAPTGESPYLERKQLKGESCRYLSAPMTLRWPGRRDDEPDTVVKLPAGTLLVPMIRFDLARADALRGLQFIRPDGAKIYLRGLEKPGCAVRLGAITEAQRLLLVCEGYATGLTIRLAVDQQHPVFVAFDAGNLVNVVRLLRELYPDARILICADDDWKTVDQITKQPSNPGRTTAKKVAKEITACDLVWPVFAPSTRQDKDTDFDDLRQRQGLPAVQHQLQGVISAMRRLYG